MWRTYQVISSLLDGQYMNFLRNIVLGEKQPDTVSWGLQTSDRYYSKPPTADERDRCSSPTRSRLAWLQRPRKAASSQLSQASRSPQSAIGPHHATGGLPNVETQTPKESQAERRRLCEELRAHINAALDSLALGLDVDTTTRAYHKARRQSSSAPAALLSPSGHALGGLDRELDTYIYPLAPVLPTKGSSCPTMQHELSTKSADGIPALAEAGTSYAACVYQPDNDQQNTGAPSAQLLEVDHNWNSTRQPPPTSASHHQTAPQSQEHSLEACCTNSAQQASEAHFSSELAMAQAPSALVYAPRHAGPATACLQHPAACGDPTMAPGLRFDVPFLAGAESANTAVKELYESLEVELQRKVCDLRLCSLQSHPSLQPTMCSLQHTCARCKVCALWEEHMGPCTPQHTAVAPHSVVSVTPNPTQRTTQHSLGTGSESPCQRVPRTAPTSMAVHPDCVAQLFKCCVASQAA